MKVTGKDKMLLVQGAGNKYKHSHKRRLHAANKWCVQCYAAVKCCNIHDSMHMLQNKVPRVLTCQSEISRIASSG